jgi:hypothetical protein
VLEAREVDVVFSLSTLDEEADHEGKNVLGTGLQSIKLAFQVVYVVVVLGKQFVKLRLERWGFATMYVDGDNADSVLEIADCAFIVIRIVLAAGIAAEEVKKILKFLGIRAETGGKTVFGRSCLNVDASTHD